MTIYEYEGRASAAAHNLIQRTCLTYLPIEALNISDGGEPLLIDISDDWGWSSGERDVLIPLLKWLPGSALDPELPDFLAKFETVDTETRRACWDTVAIALEAVPQ